MMVPIEIINCFDGIEDVVNERIAIVNEKAIDKKRKDNPDLQITYTTKQDEIMANKSIEGYITDRKKYEILYRCYGLVVRQVMKGGSCCRLPFSYKLPSPSAVVSAIVNDPKYSKFLDELEKPRQTASEVKPVPNRHTGAPPSADNV